MDPVLQALYTNLMAAAPYVIAAYALLWVGLMVYVVFIMRRLGKLEKQMDVLDDSIVRRNMKSEA